MGDGQKKNKLVKKQKRKRKNAVSMYAYWKRSKWKGKLVSQYACGSRQTWRKQRGELNYKQHATCDNYELLMQASEFKSPKISCEIQSTLTNKRIHFR